MGDDENDDVTMQNMLQSMIRVRVGVRVGVRVRVDIQGIVHLLKLCVRYNAQQGPNGVEKGRGSIK